MKIRSLHLEHFRKFAEPVCITGLTDGLNVFAERNEFGKSTILAAIRGVLFERHASRAQSVASMQHRSNKTSPVVALEFELAQQRYRIEKRFLHREPYAKLTLPDGSLHQGDAAEERLQEVLHFTRAGNTGSKSENIGMWGALWVPQRQSVDQPDLPDSAKQTIHGCLDQEVGAIAGGTRGRALLNSARGELSKLQNGNGKPVGRYKEALAELDKVQERVAELEARQQILMNDIAALVSARRSLAQMDASGEETRNEHLLREAQSKREEAQRYEDREKTAAGEEKLAEARLAGVQREMDARAQLQDRVQDAERRIGIAVDLEKKTHLALKQGEEALKQQQDRIREARDRCDTAGLALRRARAVQDLAVNAQTLIRLQDKLFVAEHRQARVNELAAHLLSFTVTEQGLSNARAAARRIEKSQAVLEAQATHVTFDLLPEASGSVLVDGTAPPATPLAVITDLLLEIQGVGTIRIQPGIRNRELLLSQLAEEKRLLRTALETLGVETLEQAESQFSARQRCEQELTQAKAALASDTLEDTNHQLPAGIEALRNHIMVLRSSLTAALVAANLEVAPVLDSAREAVQAAQRTEEDQLRVAGILNAPLAELEKEHARVLRAHTQAESEWKAIRQEHQRLTQEYNQALAQEDPETLAQRRVAAAASLQAQRALIDEMRKSRPTDSVADMEIRIRRLESARKLLSADRIQTQQQIAILESRIEREEGIGIEEQIAEAQRRRDELSRECSRYLRERKALELLLDTLECAEQAAKERYMAPVVKRIAPYLQRLFPGAGISCDENFQITGVVREFEQAERFDKLSDGTQEQIAVLTRLAFAEMLLDSGRPAMVILDDALAYSDSERLERMFDLLSQAALRMQILILTCRGELFTRLGGSRVRLTSVPPSNGIQRH